jgi:class 3 adenylate cyclase
MAELPSGTVTFLFTDIEGSTKLLHELGAEEYERALAEHRRILRAAFVGHGGVEVDTQGDAFFVAFPTAQGAVSAADAALEGPIAIVRLASVVAAQGRAQEAAEMLASADALSVEIGADPQWAVRVKKETRARARDQLGEVAFAEAWERGLRLTADEAVARAAPMSGTQDSPARPR